MSSRGKIMTTSYARKRVRRCGLYRLGPNTDAQEGSHWPARAGGGASFAGRASAQGARRRRGPVGGESCADLVVELVHTGRLDEARVDQSVRRLLRLKFQLGLFDNPFVDEEQVAHVLGDPTVAAAGGTSKQGSEPAAMQSALVRTQDGFVFRDLNKNGKLADAVGAGGNTESLCPRLSPRRPRLQMS